MTNSNPWAAFSGPNLGYVMDMYDLYLTSPEEVDAELVALFEQLHNRNRRQWDRDVARIFRAYI